jgi:toxin ParE1/3/4
VYRGLKEAILSLEEKPDRCPETPETPKLRNLLYGHKPRVYRVIYRVAKKGKQVDVLHIRHAARQSYYCDSHKLISALVRYFDETLP